MGDGEDIGVKGEPSLRRGSFWGKGRRSEDEEEEGDFYSALLPQQASEEAAGKENAAGSRGPACSWSSEIMKTLCSSLPSWLIFVLDISQSCVKPAEKGELLPDRVDFCLPHSSTRRWMDSGLRYHNLLRSPFTLRY